MDEHGIYRWFIHNPLLLILLFFFLHFLFHPFPVLCRLDPADAGFRGENAVVHAVDLVRHGGDVFVVRDHDERLVLDLFGFQKKLHQLRRALLVEVAGRLVGEHQRRIVHKRPGDRDTLLLTAGQFVRQMVDAVRDAENFQKLVDVRIRELPSVEQGGHDDVFKRCEYGDQIVILENKADVLTAEHREFVAFQPVDILPVDVDRAAGGRVQPAAELQQRRFPRAGRADDGDEFLLLHLEVAGLDGGNDVVALMVDLGKIIALQYC